MKTNEILPTGNIKLGLSVNGKKDLLNKMCELLARSGNVKDLNKLKSEVAEREKLMTTGIGGGVALPHAKTNSVSGTIGAFARLKEPVQFDSIDDIPVKYVYLLAGREENTGNFLRLLSKLARIMSDEDYLLEIDKYHTTEEIFNFFVRVEDEE